MILPKSLRSLHNWHPGQKLQVIDTAQPFEETTLAGVAGCLSCTGKAKTLEEMSEAIIGVGWMKRSASTNSFGVIAVEPLTLVTLQA